jgi:drug/metabolite transporter, DME family
MAAVTTTLGAAAMVPVPALLARTGEPVATSDPVALALLAYLGVMTMAVATCLVFSGLRVVTSSAATLTTLLEPITAAAIAAGLLEERLGPEGWMGMTLVLAALAGLATRRTP